MLLDTNFGPIIYNDEDIYITDTYINIGNDGTNDYLDRMLQLIDLHIENLNDHLDGGTGKHDVSEIDNAISALDFNENTILSANVDNTPTALTVDEQTLIGRLTSGNIDALTPAQVRSLLLVNIAQEINVAKNGSDVTGDGSIINPYATIQGVINLITDASPSKRYVIKIHPGYYTENIILKSYVFLQGSGSETTHIKTTGSGDTIIAPSAIGFGSTGMYDLSVENESSVTTDAGIRCEANTSLINVFIYTQNAFAISADGGYIYASNCWGASFWGTSLKIKNGAWLDILGGFYVGWGGTDIVVDSGGTCSITSDTILGNNVVSGSLTYSNPASLINNDSNLSGVTVKDALNNIMDENIHITDAYLNIGNDGTNDNLDYILSLIDTELGERIDGDTGSTSNAILIADGTNGRTLKAATNVTINNNSEMIIGDTTSDAMLNIKCRDSNVEGMRIKAAVGQTADLLKIVDSGNGALFEVNYKGDIGITVQSPNEPLHVQSDYDGNRAIRMGNESNGTSAVARFIVDVLGGSAFLAAYGSNFTTSGSKRANSASLITNASMASGMSIVARHSTTGHVRIYTGGNADANERVIVQADGIVKIGDLDSTHFAQFAPDGEITLSGTARVKKPCWIPANAIQAPQSRPATLIDHGISVAWQFGDVAVEVNTEQIRANIGLPSDMDITVVPALKIGWSSNTTSADCNWQIEYLYRGPDEDTTAAAQETLISAETSSSTADGLVVSEFTLQTPSASDACIHIRITRRSDDAADTINADTVELQGMCLYYTSNRLGEAL